MGEIESFKKYEIFQAANILEKSIFEYLDAEPSNQVVKKTVEKFSQSLHDFKKWMFDEIFAK